ncbi:hypothetical protein QYF61_026510 [Mycteria americana]|uniref:Uncharacterized protein n=1 Tax=Mycteria americana TaxID=33587 RepID=A0AAN7NBL6_MYCAM|nr:hypothetical protein QYF61_026510 [Mycteria americana]
MGLCSIASPLWSLSAVPGSADGFGSFTISPEDIVCVVGLFVLSIFCLLLSSWLHSCKALPWMLTFMAQVLFRVFFKNVVHHPLIILSYFFLEIYTVFYQH